MTTYPIKAYFKNPYSTPLENLVKVFEKAIHQVAQKPYKIEKIAKTLGKKLHIQFQTSQRVAIMTLLKFACDPKSIKNSKLRRSLGLENTKSDGIHSMINTLSALVCLCNLATFQIGIKKGKKFSYYSQPYIAKVAGCCSQTIYRHLKHLSKTGLMKQVSRNKEVSEGIYIYHTSCKIIFERLFEVLGVKTAQLMQDHAYQKRKELPVPAAKPARKPKPVVIPPKPVVNPTDENEFAKPIVVTRVEAQNSLFGFVDLPEKIPSIEELKQLNALIGK